MTDTKPTIEEQILQAQRNVKSAAFYESNLDVEKAILASLKELQNIKSQPVPVEPTMLAAMRLVGNAPEVISYVDALQSELASCKHNSSVTMDELGEMRDRAEKADLLREAGK